MRGAIKSLIVLVVMASIVSVGGAFAARNAGGQGKPSGGGGGSVSLRLLDPADTQANIGDKGTFDVSSSYAKVWVAAKCYQGGTLVYSETRGFFPDYPWGQTYTFGPTGSWAGGSASCRGDLITVSNTKTITLATTTFTVYG